MTLTKTVTLRHEQEITLPSSVWVDIKWEIPQGWHPTQDKAHKFVLRVEADTEEEAERQLLDAVTALEEAFAR